MVLQIIYYGRLNKNEVESETNSEKADDENKKSEIGTGEKMSAEEKAEKKEPI